MSGVLGLGNALVDLIFQIEDDGILNDLELPKGSMTLVNESTARQVLNITKDLHYEIAAGGSASNTIDGLAKLNVDCGYIGKIGNDKYGDLFQKELISKHIFPRLYYGKKPTGTAITFLSKDAERTFATCLGAAIELEANDLKEEHFKGYSYFHIEGYLVQNQKLITRAVQLAKKMGQIISIDMASYNIVEENRDFLSELIRKYVDIVFANEEEAKAFTHEDPARAAKIIAETCQIAVVKTGKKGSFIQEGKNQIKINSIPVEVKDTTGAGDLYAAGFLYGQMHHFNLELSGNIGSLLGGRVIEVYGARLNERTWSAIRGEIDLLVKNNADI